MHGRYRVRVKNDRNTFQFELVRNITVLRGESGRGKSTLFEMIREYNRFGRNSGVAISCDRNLFALGGEEWEETIAQHKGQIIVVDEDSRFVRSDDFARFVKGSDNYFLLITRNYLPALPISVDEIYELSGAKNKRFKKIYTDIYKMYNDPDRRRLPFVPEVIITEDSKSGFQFFRKEAERLGIICESAEGKSNIYRVIQRYENKNVVVVANGAAFGAEIHDLVEQQKLRPRKLAMFLPESFEWVILKSGVVKGIDDEKIDQAEMYADSTEFMSWEQYFTLLLQELTKTSGYMKYKKGKLANYYTEEKQAAEIRSIMNGIKL